MFSVVMEKKLVKHKEKIQKIENIYRRSFNSCTSNSRRDSVAVPLQRPVATPFTRLKRFKRLRDKNLMQKQDRPKRLSVVFLKKMENPIEPSTKEIKNKVNKNEEKNVVNGSEMEEVQNGHTEEAMANKSKTQDTPRKKSKKNRSSKDGIQEDKIETNPNDPVSVIKKGFSGNEVQQKETYHDILEKELLNNSSPSKSIGEPDIEGSNKEDDTDSNTSTVDFNVETAVDIKSEQEVKIEEDNKEELSKTELSERKTNWFFGFNLSSVFSKSSDQLVVEEGIEVEEKSADEPMYTYNYCGPISGRPTYRTSSATKRKADFELPFAKKLDKCSEPSPGWRFFSSATPKKGNDNLLDNIQSVCFGPSTSTPALAPKYLTPDDSLYVNIDEKSVMNDTTVNDENFKSVSPSEQSNRSWLTTYRCNIM